MNTHILLVGSGNIGLRHLQAIATLPHPLDITVVEPNAANREKAATALAELPSHIALRFLPDWSGVPPQVDLAIIATPAQPRRKALESLLQHTTPAWLLLEKVVFVTHRDFAEMAELLTQKGVKTVVNCGRRGFGGYDRLRDVLRGKQAPSMHVTGSNWGIGSNSIHFIDLACHIFGALPTSLSSEALSEPQPSRHTGCVEFTGTLAGSFENGGNITLTSLSEPGQALTVEVTAGAERWLVEEGQRRITHWDGDRLVSTEAFDAPFVSQMGYLYEEILLRNASRLPTLALSARQHRLVIDAFRHRLGQSLEEDSPCPIS